ncbi:hypothetical protein DFH09DRAFT_1085545 [Mycena vulgaris]|nr:hypothetical protein DFH09DRAFT_1085545 [Mycena vulgaris]
MATLQFGGDYWEKHLPGIHNLSSGAKLHLILSLVIYLGVSIRAFLVLVFIFESNNQPMREMITPLAHALVLEESDTNIEYPSLQIRIKDLTIARMRELLQPGVLADKYRGLARLSTQLRKDAEHDLRRRKQQSKIKSEQGPPRSANGIWPAGTSVFAEHNDSSFGGIELHVLALYDDKIPATSSGENNTRSGDPTRSSQRGAGAPTGVRRNDAGLLAYFPYGRSLRQ